MSKVFQSIRGANPRYSAFDLSYSKQFNCDMGQLIPIMFEECIPGDRFTIGAEALVEMQSMVVPVRHNIKVKADYFFVATRNIMNEETMEEYGDLGTWEEFITGGQKGPQADGSDEIPLPLWEHPAGGFKKYSPADYFGLPLGVNIPDEIKPIRFPLRVMNQVWNEHYRDQDLQDEVSLDQDEILYRNWTKDYFTISRPWQLRGDPPALPISTIGHAEFFDGTNPLYGIGHINNEMIPLGYSRSGRIGPLTGYGSVTTSMIAGANPSLSNANANPNPATGIAKALSDSNRLQLSNTTFNVSDIRLAFRLQEWMERNARAGVRYTEYLVAQHGVKAQDFRLQRPEYIGGMRDNIIVTEVLQTSETTGSSPQGNKTGHGITSSSTHVGKYYVREHGYIIGLMSITPEPVYYQGVPKKLIRRTRYDFPNDLFAHLSETPILNGELCVTGNAIYDKGFFGYQGIFDEMRQNTNMVCGDMRDTLDYWNLARKFNRNSPPKLNAEFISTKNTIRKDIFIVQDEPGFIVHWGNRIRAVRPLPIIADPRT